MGGRAVAVMGRYLGVVGVLADVLRGAGLDVVVTWAADDPAGPPRPTTANLADPGGIVVVVTVAPGDPTLQDLRTDGLTGPVVAVTWHPPEERGAVPKQVIRFLNVEQNRTLIRGVIAAGNTNFGDAFCAAGDIISRKCHVPHLYRLELFGTSEDVTRVSEGLERWWKLQ